MLKIRKKDRERARGVDLRVLRKVNFDTLCPYVFLPFLLIVKCPSAASE